MASITSINTVFVLSVPSVIFATQLQGYSADDIFTTDPLQVKEIAMGVDGILSAGRVNVPVKMGIALMADSPSISLFESWNTQERAVNDTYFANATVVFPSIGRKYNCNKGVLETYPVMSDARRTLQPRRFNITWQSVTSAIT